MSSAIRSASPPLRPAACGLRLKRDQTERALADQLIGLASGVRGHPEYGSDSPFYRALGFVPDSENRSGRPRKPKP